MSEKKITLEDRVSKLERSIRTIMSSIDIKNGFNDADKKEMRQVDGENAEAIEVTSEGVSENDTAICDVAELSDVNSTAIDDLAEMVDELMNRVSDSVWTIYDVPNTWRSKTESKVIADGYHFDSDGTAVKNEEE